MRKGFKSIAIPLKQHLIIKGKDFVELAQKCFTEMYSMLNAKQQERLWAKLPNEMEILDEVLENAFVPKAKTN